MEIPYTLEESERVDKFLSVQLSDYTRSYIQKLIKNANITVNKKVIKANYKLSKGDIIVIDQITPVVADIVAEDIPLDIVYEDDHLLVVNKAQGMVVHPAPGHYSGTLVNAIMFHCKDRLSSINGVARPGIVHRIDKDTSGLLIVCKTDKAHQDIARQLKEHSATRLYEAIVYHNVKDDEGFVDAPIGRGEKDRKKMTINHKNGKEAKTHYFVLQRLDHNKYTYLKLKLETGRTHQIRVHMTSIGHPLVGDPLYGPKKAPFTPNGQLLHAKTIGFIHPVTQEYMEFSVEPPETFSKVLNNLRNRK